MKKILFTLIIITAYSYSFSQVLGVSASKLASINAYTAVKNQVEFEPGFGYFWAKSHYNGNGDLEKFDPNDSTAIFQQMAFRITYGIGEKFEAGIFIASDMSSLSMGLKYTLFSRDKFGAAIIAGSTFANESDIVAVNSGIFGKTVSLSIGTAFTYQFSDKLSVDTDIQYQCIRDDEVSYSNDMFINTEFGYCFENGLQLISGFSYTLNKHTHKYDGHTNQLLTFNVGGALCTGKNYEIVMYTPFAIYGQNYDKLNGINFALTIFIN